MSKIPNGLLELITPREITEERLEVVRRDGLGDGFSMLEPGDGFRRDGSLWFGTCSVCGESVTNSWRDGVWKHRVVTEEVRHPNGWVARSASHQVDYCPTARRGEESL